MLCIIQTIRDIPSIQRSLLFNLLNGRKKNISENTVIDLSSVVYAKVHRLD